MTDFKLNRSPTPTVRRAFVFASIIAATFMIAIEATIVATAMPQIIAHIGQDFRLYSWVFSIFLLAQTATALVFGKLADTFGRKPILLIGIALFLLSSLLCGLAWSMASLIVFRFLQGLAAGCIQPVTQTLIGDLYPGFERAKVQGHLAATYGVSAILGPLAGALIVEHLHWAWIFWINIPIGAFAAFALYIYLEERVQAERRRVDMVGAGLFMIAAATLMLALNAAGGEDWAPIFGFGFVFVLGAALFIFQQRTVSDPMLPLRLWSHRSIANLNLLALLCGAVLIGVAAFLPVYVQVVMGRSVLTAGFTLTAQVLGWTISALFAMRVFKRFGRARALVVGTAFLPVGVSGLVLLTPLSHPLLPGLGALMTGMGLGIVNTAVIFTLQESVGWAERGSATALNIFSRNLGSALGAALFGAVVNVAFQRGDAAASSSDLRTLIENPGAGTDASAMAASVMRNALETALHAAFWAMLVVTVVAAGLAVVEYRRSLSETRD